MIVSHTQTQSLFLSHLSHRFTISLFPYFLFFLFLSIRFHPTNQTFTFPPPSSFSFTISYLHPQPPTHHHPAQGNRHRSCTRLHLRCPEDPRPTERGVWILFTYEVAHLLHVQLYKWPTPTPTPTPPPPTLEKIRQCPPLRFSMSVMSAPVCK